MIRWLRRNLRRPMSNAASADYVRAHRFCVARVEFVDGNELIDILYGAGWAGYWPNTRLFLGEHGMREVRRDQVYRITCIHPWANAPAHIDNEVLSLVHDPSGRLSGKPSRR